MTYSIMATMYIASERTGTQSIRLHRQKEKKEKKMGKKNKVDEKGIPYGARERVPMWYNLAWSTRGISAALNVLLIGYISYYSSDVLGLNVTLIGVALMLSKIIDAFTDLGMGFIIDKTNTRWGKARPYEIFIVIEWIITVLMYSVPDIPKVGQYIWLFVTYVLINAVCTTALGGADSVYMARTFTTEKNRLNAMSVNGVVVMLSSIIFNIILPQFISNAGTSRSGWQQLAIMMAVPLAILGILRFVICKEVPIEKTETDEAEAVKDKPAAQTTESLGLPALVKLLVKNKYVFLLIGLMFVTNVINNIGTATTYYFKYMVGDVSLMSLVNMTALVTPVILIIFPLLAKKFGTTMLLRASMVFGIVGIGIRTIGGVNMTTIMIGSLLSSVAVLPISMMINTYLIDTMDYGEWKTGVRIEGLVASVVNFSGKLGSSVASGFVGLVLGLAGYDGTLEVQSAAANAAITGMYNIFPLVLYVIMFILAMLYQMDKIKPQMMQDLAAKRAAK